MPDDKSNDWEATLDDLGERRGAARAMGGEERLAKHRAAGKLDARARVAHLLDTSSASSAAGLSRTRTRLHP